MPENPLAIAAIHKNGPKGIRIHDHLKKYSPSAKVTAFCMNVTNASDREGGVVRRFDHV